MDAATLRVLVEVNGVRRATKDLRDVDNEGTRAARSANSTASGFDKMDRSSRRASKGFQGLAAASGGGNRGVNNLARNLDRFGGSADGATATIGGFRIALAALVPLTIGFGGAAVAAGASLGPLVGLAAAAGNAFAAAAQGFGVFKLAVAGIGGALKEQMGNQAKAGGAAGSNASAQRSAANSIRSAQEGVADAVRNASAAQRDQRDALAALAPAYTEARRKIVDMREALKDANLSLKSARFAAQDARAALAQLLSGPDPRDLAKAHDAVSEALKGERDAARGLADAHRELADLLKPVDVLDLADAQDAVADSVRNEEHARLALNAQIKKTNEVLKDPKATADDKAAARLDLADAENAVGDATRESERVRQRLNTLEAGPDQAAVEAARRHVSDAEEAVMKAAKDTAAARTDLADLEKPAAADALARARLDVAVAENALTDAMRDQRRIASDLRAADAKGVEGSAEVVAARKDIADASERLADANRSVAKAQRAVTEAEMSAKDAMAGAAGGAAALNDKMNDLPPAAQAFVRTLIAMKPRLDELRSTAAQGFFPGATEGLKAAMGSFSSVNKVVGETASVLGDAARKSGELVGSPAFGSDIQTIGSSNARVIGTLGEALRHVVSALRHVMVAAGPLTEWLADMANKWAQNAASAAKAGRENGKLAGFFEKTRAITERLSSILGHLASGLLGLGKMGKRTGDDIWASIDRAAGRFDEWANSVKGQKAISDFFEDAKRLAAALLPVLGGVTTGVALLVTKIFPLSAIMKVLGPYADEATVAFVAYKLAVIGVGIATKVVSAATAIATFATGGWVAAFWALNAAMAPVLLIPIAIAAVVAILIIAWKHSETFRDIVKGALKVVADAFGWMWQAAKDVFEWLKSNWPLVLTILTGPIGLAVLAIKEFGPQLFAIAKDLLNKFIGGVKSVASAIIAAGGWIVAQVVAGIKAIGGFAADVGGWIKNRVVDGIHAYADTISAVGGWITGKVGAGIKAVADFATGVGGWIKNRLVEGIHGIADGISELGGWVTGKIVAGIKAVADVASNIGGWLKDKIVAGVKAVANAFMDIGGDIIRGIAQGIRNTAGSVIRAIKEAVLDHLPGFVKKALDIHSPSRVFMELGKQIPLGMAAGIRSETGAVLNAMGALVVPPSIGQGTIGAMGYLQPTQAATAAPTAPVAVPERTGVTIMGDLIVQNKDDADRVASHLAWLGDNG